MNKYIFQTIFFIFLSMNFSSANDTNCNQTQKVVGVIELMQSPRCFKGTIELNGVVAKVTPENKTVILIDRKEIDECDDDTCPIKRLPVTWNGKMPERKSVVSVRGKVSKKDGRFIFEASSINPYKG